MGEARRRAALGAALLRTRHDYRVIESEGPDGAVRLAIRRVDYDALSGRLLRCAVRGPDIEAADGDGLVALLNDLAEALTKPSLDAVDFGPSGGES